MRAFGFVALTMILAGSVRADTPPTPRLAVDPGEGTYRIWVALGDGATERRLVRETATVARPGPAGADPAGRAFFATWTEVGSGTWFVYSRDAGSTWSDARRLDVGLRLHDGTASPGQNLPTPPDGLGLPPGGRLFLLVQFRTVSLPEWRTALDAMGAEVVAFFPHNAHVLRVSPALTAQIAALDFVERVEAYHPSYRLERELRSWVGGASEAMETEQGELRVRVVAFEWGPEGKDRIVRAAEAAGARVAELWPSGHIVELWVTREQLGQIAAHDDVMWIDRWTPREDDMDIVREDSGANWLETGFGYCGDDVRGEVMDSGIQATHQDFDGLVIHGSHDTSSHGTSTYGIVFGNGDRDGDGNAQATGHMPCSSAQGIFADYGFLSDRFAHTQELKQAPYLASFQTNSWGSTRTTQYTSVSSEMDDIIWRLDIAITQSQSNAGSQNSRPQAWAKNIISVGGIYHFNNLDPSDDAWNNGASIGPAADGRIKPDVHYFYDSIFTTTTGGGYTSSFCCTSAATPQVAGALGLMAQLWAENAFGTNPQGAGVFEKLPHFSTLKALLVNTAQQYTFSGTGADLTRTHQGWGRPNVQIAKERGATSFIVDEDFPLTLGEVASFEVEVTPGETELKITMTYPDPPGTTSSTLHRINDVDLRVTSPSDVVYHGNVGLDAGNYSVPGGSPNGIDTVENVFVQNPEDGIWTIEVEAAEVNQDGHLATGVDDVAFALVVTGAVSTAVCGDGILDFGEACDGPDLGGANCQDVACGSGIMGCTAQCTLDPSQCTGCPSCGDGTCQLTEDCLSCPSDCISAPQSVCGNDICEIGNGENCEECPQDCQGVQSGNPNFRYCCGDGAGTNPIGCSDSRCSTAGNTCTETPSLLYCCGDGTCEIDETASTCIADCAPPTPGEAASLRVTGYDPGTGMLSLSYGSGCQATDHVIEYGELTTADLSSYNWSGRECAIGSSGAAAWSQTGLPDSIFFVVVANDGSTAGSYGRSSAAQERPESTNNVSCPAPQNLLFRCD